MFLALRDLRRGWRRFTLVGTVVALVAVLSTVLSGLADGLVRDGTSGLRALPITHLAFAPHAKAVFSRSTLDGRTLAAWRAVPGAEAAPIGVSFVNAAPAGRARGRGPSIDLALFGVRGDDFLARRDGRRGELRGLVLASELRGDGVRVGDRYRLAGSDVALPVIGFTFAGSYGHVPIAYTSLATWQAITYGRDPRGRFSAIALRLPQSTDVPAADRRAGTETKTKAQAYDGSPGFTAETATMTLIRAFLLAISALVVGAFFTVLTVQRTRQIGLLKAMGASTAYVVRDGLGQMMMIVGLATAAGVAVGAAIVAALEGGPVPVVLSPGAIAASAGLLIACGLAGSLAAYRRIARVEPAIALGVEA
jgi:putative ABC transport system permease protein